MDSIQCHFNGIVIVDTVQKINYKAVNLSLFFAEDHQYILSPIRICMTNIDPSTKKNGTIGLKIS